MNCLNVEIKAKCDNPELLRAVLSKHKAFFKGKDDQTDTYFNVDTGRLKLRQGNIENSLIYYTRKNQKGPKDSHVRIFKTAKNPELRNLLSEALGIAVEVKKSREIYFIGNVKFHIDRVPKLGNFVEIEAIDETGKIGRKKLLNQCNYYLKLFKITPDKLLNNSYSDMLRSLAKVVKSYQCAYSNPIILTKGDIVTIKKLDSKWPGWIFCENKKHIAGWVPESCFKINGLSAVASTDYNATELTIKAGEPVEIIKEDRGWSLVQNKKGCKGWIPAKNLKHF